MRTATAARLALGAAGLGQTRRVYRVWSGGSPSSRVLLVARVLAARHLLQGAVVAARPSRRMVAAGAAVDGLHGLSMVALAVVSSTYRRPAATSACVAAGFAA